MSIFRIIFAPFRMIRWHIINIVVLLIINFAMDYTEERIWLWLAIASTFGYALSMGREAVKASKSGKGRGIRKFLNSGLSSLICWPFFFLWTSGYYSPTQWSFLFQNIFWVIPWIMFAIDIAEYIMVIIVAEESSTQEVDVRNEDENLNY